MDGGPEWPRAVPAPCAEGAVGGSCCSRSPGFTGEGCITEPRFAHHAIEAGKPLRSLHTAPFTPRGSRDAGSTAGSIRSDRRLRPPSTAHSANCAGRLQACRSRREPQPHQAAAPMRPRLPKGLRERRSALAGRPVVAANWRLRHFFELGTGRSFKEMAANASSPLRRRGDLRANRLGPA
jgi:hypothetical protein